MAGKRCKLWGKIGNNSLTSPSTVSNPCMGGTNDNDGSNIMTL